MIHAFTRRKMLALAAVAASVSLSGHGVANAHETGEQHRNKMTKIPPDAPKVAMLVYPKMVAMDLIGPMTVFSIMRFNIQLVWKDKNPVSTDIGIPFAATHGFEECAKDLDVLFVPGGIMGTIDCMNDLAVCDFLADRGDRAKWVTSVCTGGLVLAAAGLLKGYDATAHWGVVDLLPLMGARYVNKRVVIDRNRMTGGGVTAGVDFGLTLAAQLKGEEAARRVQLTLEYAPEPPYSNGTPREAGPERTAAAREGRKWMEAEATLAAKAASRRMGI